MLEGEICGTRARPESRSSESNENANLTDTV
jgi:hypothetical protein